MGEIERLGLLLLRMRGCGPQRRVAGQQSGMQIGFAALVANMTSIAANVVVIITNVAANAHQNVSPVLLQRGVVGWLMQGCVQ